MDEKGLKGLFKSMKEPFYWDEKPKNTWEKDVAPALKNLLNGNS